MLRPFIPAQNHEQSRRFYEALNFTTEFVDESVAIMSDGRSSFILQNFYVKELADNFMVQLLVPDLDAWWKEIAPTQVAEKFGSKPPTPPTIQPWGSKVGFIHDPSGVLWHVTEAKDQ